MQTLAAILAAHPFFQGLDARYMELVTACTVNVRFQADHYLFHEGEQATHFYLLREGKVALETLATPHRPIVIETIEAGEVLGWSWLFPPYRWHFNARAIEPIRALMLDGACLRARGELDHDLGYELVKRMAHILIQRLQATRLQLLDVDQIQPEGSQR
jgi:CRP-like cAMP-binding protein